MSAATHMPRKETSIRMHAKTLLLCVLFAAAICILAGCGVSGNAVNPTSASLSGSVSGGSQPVVGAKIQLYAVGTEGTASAAQPLLSSPAETDANGKFSLSGTYPCPSSSTAVYVVARGGNAGLASAVNNSALTLTALAGPCGSLSTATVEVNEVTTVGTVWPLAQYMTSPTNVGAAANDATFSSAVSTVPEFVNMAQGSSPGTAAAQSYFAENSKLYSLADVLATCVDSAGGVAGDGSACGTLFSIATPAGGAAPADTMTAAIDIARNPDRNVTNIYGLVGGDKSFAPTLSTAPPDWTLTLSYVVAIPAISLASGTYTGTQQVTITDGTAGSTIHYTTDGTAPTSASPTYSTALPVSATTTVQAIATLEGSASAVAASTITIATAAPPAKLAFLQQPSDAWTEAVIFPAVQVAIEDASGNLLTTATGPITMTLAGGTGLNGTLTVNAQSGIATFNNLSVSTAGTGYTLVASSPSLASATSIAFSITSPPGEGGPQSPVRLAFVQEPTNAVTQTAISPAVKVAIEDAQGNVVADATNPVSIALAGGTALGGTLTATPVDGIATFSNLTVNVAGNAYVMSATSSGLTAAASTPFAISAPGSAAGPPQKLAFLQEPTNTLTKAAISPAVRVAVEDSNGNVVTTAASTVTLVLQGCTGLGGTLTVTAASGISTFTNLTVSTAGNGCTLAATSNGLTTADSTAFDITATVTAPSPARLAFVQQPTNALKQTAIAPPVQVAVEDATGNLVATAGNSVTLTLNGGQGLAGTLTVPAKNGIATFSNLTVNTAGSGYTFTATSTGLTSTTSTPFTISSPSSPTPAELVFMQQPTNALAQAIISPAVTVALEDANGDVVSTATNSITLALASGAGLGGTLTVSAVNGVATFNNLTISSAGTYSLSASSAGLPSLTSNSFAISNPASTSNGTTILQSMPLGLTAMPGGTFLITYNWQAVPVSGQYTVFVNFVDSSGTVQFRDNAQPPVTPSTWNGAVSYTHTVTVPSTAGAGTYTIVAGLTSTSGNLSIVAGPSVTAMGSGQYQIGTLALAPSCSITAFGAVGDGVTDNAAAMQATFAYAATTHCIAYVPAGTFAYSGMLTATGIAIAGNGATSILAPLTPANEALTMLGKNTSVSNLTMVSKAASRLTTGWSGMIWFENATNYYVQNVLINGSSSTGIMSYNSSNGYIMNNTVENTQADSITQVLGSSNVTVTGNRILNSGDDGVSNNSYAGETPVNNITVKGNTVLNNVWGRGIEVSGGTNIAFTGNYVDNTDGYTDVYIASESEWKTQSVSNVTVSGNTLVDGGPNQGSLIIYNSQGTTYTISDVTANGNQFVNPQLEAVQFAGNGPETSISVESNTDYAIGVFSNSSNPAAAPTLSSNQVLAPASYSTPMVPAGGGCSFSGC